MITPVKWWHREHLRADCIMLDILQTLEQVAKELQMRQRGWHWLGVMSCPVEDKGISGTEIPSYRTTYGKSIPVRAHRIPGS